MDFSHLTEQYEPTKIVRFTLPLEGAPYLEVRHAGKSNAAYTNAIATEGAKQKIGEKMAAATPGQMVTLQIDLDRLTFPGNVITGWGGVRTRDGKEVEFSKKACAAFMEKLPEWICERLSRFCGAPERFIPGAPTEADVTDLEGN